MTFRAAGRKAGESCASPGMAGIRPSAGGMPLTKPARRVKWEQDSPAHERGHTVGWALFFRPAAAPVPLVGGFDMMREGNIQVHSENILPVIKKWLYSDKDIFLRELISNGCDAVDKLRKLMQMGEAPQDDAKPRIRVTIDKEHKLLRVEDNGIGMTEEEVEKYITQVAFSGAQEFVQRYREKGEAESGIIGHFGLGFYSVFMVADPVEIDTLSYREGAKAVHWVSKGEAAYEIGEGERTDRGTLVTLHITDGESEFLEEPRIREILRKYCQFMPVEIYLNPKEGENPKPVNDTSPLWLKPPRECTDEEYKKFYSELFMDFNEPLFWIHLNVDYPFNLKGILYFPRATSKVEVTPGQVKLYSHQVFVADNIKEVIPEYLLLLKGVIDCPDLPLNVSRSFLQNDGNVQKISRHITKKVSDKLHSIFTDERETYHKYWDDISPFVKYGCIRDENFYDKVKDILLLKTIDGKYLILAEFPKQKDGKIYYVSDESRQAQYIRMFREQGLTAAVLDHVLDSHFISMLEYKDSSLKFARIDSDIGEALRSGEKSDDSQSLIDRFKTLAGLDKATVKAETLKSPDMPAVALVDEYMRRIQDMSAATGQAIPGSRPPETTLVLNLSNPVVQAIPSLDDENGKLVCHYVYDLARLSTRPLSADEMSGFIGRSVQLLQAVAKPKSAE